MPSAIFLSNKVQGKEGIDALSFDAITDFRVTQNAKITNNPVEDGSTISDHYFLEPKTISFSGVVTPWNFTGKGSDLTPLELIQKFESTMVGKEVLDLFLASDLQSIRNCLITGFEYSRGAKEGESILVQVKAQQISVVERAAETDISDFALAEDVSEQGQGKNNSGDGLLGGDTELTTFATSYSDFKTVISTVGSGSD